MPTLPVNNGVEFVTMDNESKPSGEKALGKNIRINNGNTHNTLALTKETALATASNP